MEQNAALSSPRKKRIGGWMIGASSLLMIFTVLCLTIFALLSLNTAVAHARLSERSAEAVAAYYEAETRAHEILRKLRQGEIPPDVTVEGELYHYTCTISDTAELTVTVRMQENCEYEIIRWQSKSTAAWTQDTQIDVWGSQ